MHEYPVTLRIIDVASDSARENGAEKVKKIKLVMGEDCGYLADSIALYFDIIAAGTLCEGAELCFEYIKPQLRCKKCGNLFLRKPFVFTCPDCDGDGEPTEIGREFYLDSIEI